MSGDVRIRTMGPIPQVDLRFDPGDAALFERLADALSVAPPRTAGRAAAAADGQGHMLWLGPDEWLVVGLEDGGADVARAVEGVLSEAAGDAFATAVDVSANRVGIEVRGPDARALLAFGCALDLDPPAFVPGRCAQTSLARANVIVWQTDDIPTYRILVRPSFASYLDRWLRDAMMGLR